MTELQVIGCIVLGWAMGTSAPFIGLALEWFMDYLSKKKVF